MRTIAALLLVGLLACAKPHMVEAPATVEIPPLPDPTPAIQEDRKERTQWSLRPEEGIFTIGGVISKYEAVYSKNKVMVVGTVRGDVLRMDCSTGATVLSLCMQSGGTFTFVCEDLAVVATCNIIDTSNKQDIKDN